MVLPQLPSFFLERFPQILHTFQQKPEPVGPCLRQAVAVGAQVVPRVEAVEGNHEICVVLSPVEHLEQHRSGRESCRGGMQENPSPRCPPAGLSRQKPAALPTWLSWARRSQRSRQMAVPPVPDIPTRCGLSHLARAGSVPLCPASHPAPPGRSRPAPDPRARPQRIPEGPRGVRFRRSAVPLVSAEPCPCLLLLRGFFNLFLF